MKEGIGALRGGADRFRRWLQDLWERFLYGDRDAPRWVAAVLLMIMLLYYPLGMLWYSRIDDDPAFQPGPDYTVEGGSLAVATAAAVVAREVDRWAPNKPFWHPAALLDNMPNYQLGLLYAVSRFAVEMGDQLGRMRGSSAIDPDLDRAAGLLKYDGRIWYWGQGNIVPTAPAQDQYEKAVLSLLAYNVRLARGDAVYDRRADNLIAFLDRVAADLGSASAALERRASESNAGYFDTKADDLFYNIKGRLYGYYLLLRDVGQDFAAVIADKQASGIWQQMLENLRVAAVMDPLIVANGHQDGFAVPSHLSAQGFYLLRARTQLREVADALLK